MIKKRSNKKIIKKFWKQKVGKIIKDNYYKIMKQRIIHAFYLIWKIYIDFEN